MSVLQIYMHYQEEDNISFITRPRFQQIFEKFVFNSKYKYVSDSGPKSYLVRKHATLWYSI